ncbi:MAG: hypothetical protein ACXWAC_08015 [Usitatibacter sp.]
MKPLRLLAAATLAALSLAAHAVGNLASITVHDRAANRTLPIYWHEGRAYVVGNPGNEYQVTVRNRAGEDLLAVVSVDGVNVMSGETATTQQGGYVVSGGERLDIRGWRKSLGEIAAFYFTSLGDSYAARTGRPANVGVIGVALFKRRPEIRPIPYSNIAPERSWEPRQKSRAESSAQPAPAAPAADAGASVSRPSYAEPSSPLGTGHGRRETSRVVWTTFDRSTDEPLETITIHYDSYSNLVARGILIAPAPRDPKPFPGFVPDPA